MSDSLGPKAESVADRADAESAPRKDYQPPTLTRIGNARDLLAGFDGSVTDAQGDPFGTNPFQSPQ